MLDSVFGDLISKQLRAAIWIAAAAQCRRIAQVRTYDRGERRPIRFAGSLAPRTPPSEMRHYAALHIGRAQRGLNQGSDGWVAAPTDEAGCVAGVCWSGFEARGWFCPTFLAAFGLACALIASTMS